MAAAPRQAAQPPALSPIARRQNKHRRSARTTSPARSRFPAATRERCPRIPCPRRWENADGALRVGGEQILGTRKSNDVVAHELVSFAKTSSAITTASVGG